MKKSPQAKNKSTRRIKKDVPLSDFYDEFEFEIELIRTLKEIRKSQGISQSDFARKIGVTQSSFCRFEAMRSNPTLIFLKKVILGLGLKITLSKDELAG